MQIPNEWKVLLENDNSFKMMFEEQKQVNPSEVVPPFFFHNFRPNGEGLKNFLTPFENGDDFYNRIIEIFGITASSFVPLYTFEEIPLYFVIREPDDYNNEHINVLAKQHIDSINSLIKFELDSRNNNNIFRSWTDDSFISPDTEVIITDNKNFESKYSFDFEKLFMDAKLYYFKYHMEKIKENPLSLFYLDPLYYMNCRYEFAFYLLYPLIKTVSTVKDPFKAYYNFWKLGLTPYISDDKKLILLDGRVEN